MVTAEDFLCCKISSWYPLFKQHTFSTVLVPLPADFVAWLVEDGVFLPEMSSAFPTRNKQDAILADDDYRDWSSDDADGDPEEGSTPPPPSFPEIAAAIETGIAAMGGAVLPKLTWSAPKDAVWMTSGNTMRCSTSDEVVLLLKSSDRVAHDISEALQQLQLQESVNKAVAAAGPQAESLTSGALEGSSAALSSLESSSPSPNGRETATATSSASDHVLALRKWYDLSPGREFRCFVVNRRLVGISQRDLSRRLSGVREELTALQRRIEAFHAAVVQPGSFPLRSFTYDCYVPAVATASIRLVDFNPAGDTTAPLLFMWEELLGGEEESSEGGDEEESKVVEMRVIESEIPLRPDTALYGVPFDFVDAARGSALTALLEHARGGESVWTALNDKTAGPSNGQQQ